MLGCTRLSWGLLFILLLVNVALNSGRKPGAPISKKIGSADKPRRPKPSSELGPKRKGTSAAAPPSAASRKPKSAPLSKRKPAPVVLDLDDDEDEMESFSSSRDRRRGGGASSDFSSFGNRAVKGSRSRRPLDEEDEDEEDEDDMPAPRGRARGGRRPLDEEDDEEEEDEEEDMDEDDEDEDFGGRYSSRRSSSKPSKKKGKGGRYRVESKGLQPYKQGYQVNRVPLQARLMRNINMLGEKVSGIATKGKKMTRELKEYFSGDFESMLLKVTRPDDQRPPEDVVGAILDATGTFYRDEDVSAGTNPYRVTLRKLWTKMAERDWRTVAKALYVFHVLLRECEPDDVRIFKKIYLKMCKETCKKTKDRYFNIKRIQAVDPGDGQIVNAKSFIERYTKYVLQRAKTFTSKFEEMKVIGERDITPKDLVGQLLKADKVIASGVECLLDTEDESEVTIMCVELVAEDVHDLFRLFHDKLRWVLDNEAQALEGTDPEEVTKILDRFKNSYDEQYPKVESFLAATADMLSAYGMKLKVRLEPKHNFAAEEALGDDGSGDAGADVAAATSTAKGAKGAAAPGAYSNEEGTVEEEADLTAYDDATPWDGGATRSGAGRKAAPPSQDDDEDYEE